MREQVYNIDNLPDFYSVRNNEQIDYSFEGMQDMKCFVFFDNGFCSSYVGTSKYDIRFIWDGFLLFVNKNISLDDIKMGINLYETRIAAFQRTGFWNKATSDQKRKYVMDKLIQNNIEYQIMKDKNEIELRKFPSKNDLWSTRDELVLDDAVSNIRNGMFSFCPFNEFVFNIKFEDSKLPDFNYYHKGGIILRNLDQTIIVRLLNNRNKLTDVLQGTLSDDTWQDDSQYPGRKYNMATDSFEDSIRGKIK